MRLLMTHKACMPVYMNSGKIVAGRDGWTSGESKVLQEVLADLKKNNINVLVPTILVD